MSAALPSARRESEADGGVLNTPTADRARSAIERDIDVAFVGTPKPEKASATSAPSEGSQEPASDKENVAATAPEPNSTKSDATGNGERKRRHRHRHKHRHGHRDKKHSTDKADPASQPSSAKSKSKSRSSGKSKHKENNVSKNVAQPTTIASPPSAAAPAVADESKSKGKKSSRSKSGKSSKKKRSKSSKTNGGEGSDGALSVLVSPRKSGAPPSSAALSAHHSSSALGASPRVELTASGALTGSAAVGAAMGGETLLQSDVPRSFIADEHVTLRVTDGLITFTREDGTKMIYGGRAERIVEQLLQWIVSEPNRQSVFRLVNVFLSCIGKFMKPVQVLDMLLAHWYRAASLAPDEAVRARSSVSLFLGEWLSLQYSDLAEGEALRRLEDFLKGLDKAFREAIVAKVHQLTHRTPPPTQLLFTPAVGTSRRLDPGRFGFVDLKPRAIAEQWTMLDMRNFRRISRREFLAPNASSSASAAAASASSAGGASASASSGALSSGHGGGAAASESFTPRVDESAWEAMLRRAAMFSRWVASEIVQHVALQRRVEVMRRFVLVALAFLELNNFNGVMSVWGGLNCTAVHRLQRTKKALPKKERELWSALASKLSEAQNFGQLRKAMERQAERGEPLVPWFELINKLRNWADNYNDYITQTSAFSARAGEQPLLNFGKMYIIGEQMLAFDRYQRVNEPVFLGNESDAQDAGKPSDASAMRSYLEHLPTFSDDVLWRLSTQCEPDQTGLGDAAASGASTTDLRALANAEAAKSPADSKAAAQ